MYYACIHAPGAEPAECARAFAPFIEMVSSETVVFSIEGLERLAGPPEQLAEAILRRLGTAGQVAIAPNPDVAVIAARCFTGVTVIPPGREAERLAALPVTALDSSPETLDTLALWGIRTLGDLSALPESGIAARLGESGVRLWRLARGESSRPVVPEVTPFEARAVCDLDHPIELLEPLAFVLANLAGELCRRLEQHSMAAIAIRLKLKLENRAEHVRVLRLPVPMREPRTFLKLLQLDLSAHPPPAAVTGASLEFDPARPRAAQSGLFVPLAPEPEKLELLLARLSALVGENNVGATELVDTHRPGAFRMKRFAASSCAAAPAAPRAPRLAFRAFRPARPSAVEAPSGYPARIAGRAVSALAGPWRTSGDWWRPGAWDRDEWDVALADGLLCRVLFEKGQWLIEGVYD